MAVADSYSAMTTDRPYRKGMPPSQAIDQLRKGVGTQFDPAMVEAFLLALISKAKSAA
jgi:HD-GYP domain-containing protein (c-di-GMP phosphodiesterase class II)